MKITLIQIREDRKEMEFERNAFLRSGGLGENQLISIDYLKEGLGRSAEQADAIIIGGSKYGAAKNDPDKLVPRLDEFTAFIQAAIQKEIPLLGVCFGHQLLAYALGGEVINDEDKEERGTIIIKKTDGARNDLVFSNLPRQFYAQCAHHDRVVALPPQAVILAKSELCPIHAFRFGKNVYGTQFHPERSKEDYEEIIKWRFADNAVPGWAADLRPSKEAETVIKRFIVFFAK